MDDAYKTLLAFGLPDGAVRAPPTSFDDEAARRAIRDLLERGVSDLREREVLAAWLGAFRHHWPRRFRAALGSDGEQAHARWSQGVDANRYLKLRRIAIENLSRAV